MRTNTNNSIKKLLGLFAGAVVFFSLTGCTKSFCTNQDKANQLYAYYGNLYDTSVDMDDAEGNQNLHRESLYTTLSESNGYSLPDKDFLNFMDDKVTDFVTKNTHLWTDGTIAEEEAATAEKIAKNVAIYAGFDTETNTVADLWTNFDAWYLEAVQDPTIGYLKAPSEGYITALKSACTSAINSNTSCITPESKTFNMNGVDVYVEGKSWGQAFKDYGFFEGLLVYPIAYLTHVISEGLGNNGWAQIFAIFVITLIVRSITVVSTVFQGKTQAKQAKIQPLLNDIAAKYPNSGTDRDQMYAMQAEQQKVMKANKVHPLLPTLFMFIQFPLFICVWSALQGSASLAGGNWLGLPLTTTVSECFTSFSTVGVTGYPYAGVVGIVTFIFMALANVLSTMTSQWFTSWRTKNFNPAPKKPAGEGQMDPATTGKTMMIVMMVFIIIMGWSLPVAMGIYWIIGALMAIIQALISELIQMKERHRLAAETGDGSTLAALRRSKNHKDTKAAADKKKSKSDKPLWR